MSPLMNSVLQAFLRWALGPAIEWMVRRGILGPDQTVQFVAEVVGYGVTLIWAIYAWVKAHRKQATTIAVMNTLTGPGAKNLTSADIDQVMLQGDTAPARTPSNAVPVMTGTGDGLSGIRTLTGTGNGRRLPVILLALALSSLTLAGCAGTLPRIAALPAQVESANTNVLAVTGNLEQLLAMAAGVVNAVGKIEDAGVKGGAVPPTVDASFDKAMLAYADASDRASKALVAAGTKTWPQLRALVQPVLEQGQALIDIAGRIGAIKSTVHGWLAQLGSVLSSLAGAFLTSNLGAFGGGR